MDNFDLIWEMMNDDEELDFVVDMIFGDELHKDADNNAADNAADNAHQNRAQRRSWEWWEAMEDPLFHENFRMTRPTFELLLAACRTHLQQNNRLLRLRTPLSIASMMGLWMLATGDTLRSAGVNFGVSRGVIFFHYVVLIEALREMAPTYIRWPDAAERGSIKARYEDSYGYPGVIGCIDGTNIYVTAPLVNKLAYQNRHDTHSILAQAVCDDKHLVRDVYVGEPGSVGDARTFNRSTLFRSLTTRADLVNEDEHILGDGAYPLSRFLLKPYQDDGHLTHRQRHHNYMLSRARSSVERMFARWKGKFRRVKLMYSFNIHYAIDHIMASFVLHNFIIVNGAEAQGLQVNGNPQAQHQYNEERSYEHGMAKREYIAYMLQPEEQDENLDDPDDPV